MKVIELIEKLRECPQDADVVHQSTGGVLDEVIIVEVVNLREKFGKGYDNENVVYLP